MIKAVCKKNETACGRSSSLSGQKQTSVLSVRLSCIRADLNNTDRQIVTPRKPSKLQFDVINMKEKSHKLRRERCEFETMKNTHCSKRDRRPTHTFKLCEIFITHLKNLKNMFSYFTAGGHLAFKTPFTFPPHKRISVKSHLNNKDEKSLFVV